MRCARCLRLFCDRCVSLAAYAAGLCSACHAAREANSRGVQTRRQRRAERIRLLFLQVYEIVKREADVINKPNRPTFAERRAIAFWLLRRLSDATTTELGRAAGGLDHSTVVRAIALIERNRADLRVMAERLLMRFERSEAGALLYKPELAQPIERSCPACRSLGAACRYHRLMYADPEPYARVH